ncbi:MAG: uracil-DNA glycosylase [Planctomycetes bacterium]|nr:uracil-DNA glycosylase [Planctomycetota bacterium]
MTSPDVTDDDPREELSALAGAVAREVRWRRWLGATSEPRAPRAAPRVAAVPTAAASTPRPVTVAATPRAPNPMVREAPKAPTPRAVATSSALVAAEAKAQEIRALAAASTNLVDLAARVAECTACGLCKTRKQTVFADGRARVPVLFVGEAPGEQEDLQGLPFVGRAGALLTDIITKGMGLTREDVYIANVLKCRPPENRDPTEHEKLLCTPWLDRQIELVDPKVIIPLGRHAAMHVLKVEASMGSLRGRVHELGGRKVVPTYHPAYLLRDESKKKDCWKDIQLAMAELGLGVRPRSGS